MHICLLLFAATVWSRPLVRTDLSVIMARQPMTILVLCSSEFQRQGLKVHYLLPVYFSGIDLKVNTTYLCSISVVLTQRSTPPTCVVLQWYYPEGQYHLPVQYTVARRDSYSLYLVVCGCTNYSCSYLLFMYLLQINLIASCHHIILCISS